MVIFFLIMKVIYVSRAFFKKRFKMCLLIINFYWKIIFFLIKNLKNINNFKYVITNMHFILKKLPVSFFVSVSFKELNYFFNEYAFL